MEDVNLKIIDALKKELEEKERNLILAAKYGKDLLDQNAELHFKMEMLIQEDEKKIENLEQEKYTISLKLEAKEKMLSSIVCEMESQEKIHCDKLRKICKENEEHTLKLNHTISLSNTKVESLEKKLQLFKEKSENLENLLEKLQQKQIEKSFINSTVCLESDSSELQHQLHCLSAEKQDLESEILNVKSQLKSAALNIRIKEDELLRSQLELQEKDCHITNLYNEVNRLKNENEELRMEREQLKFAETDPKKKGNSLFAELEDNRQELEKRVISLTSKLSARKKECDFKTQQIRKLKIDVSSLLAMTSNAEDVKYQKYIEDSLVSAMNQISNLTNKLEELEEQSDKQKYLEYKKEILDSSSTGNYLKYLYEESQNKIKTLQEELRVISFSKISLRDQNLQLMRKLYQSEKHCEASRAEIIRLNVKIEEMFSKYPFDLEEKSAQEMDEFHYEKLSASKPKAFETSFENCVTKQPLQAIESQISNHKNLLQGMGIKNGSAICENRTEKDRKERVVAFSLENDKEENFMNETSLKQPQQFDKAKKKMEAPIIKEPHHSQSSDCHLQ
ncbi:UNVERIFIED_CONTAM: hypothetical protein RMT77_009463 [Armadillidium vulgare]